MNCFGVSCFVLLVATAVSPAASLDAPELVVPLGPGKTRLTELGLYRVGWQSYGQQPAWMPVSWAGHFDAATGISYTKWNRVEGREALLMHSPWHVPPGKTWADYRLALPTNRPIRLDFGIAMGPDVAVPGKSDGVTFSCFLTVDGRERELMRKHHDKSQWLDYSFDLSPYAGRIVGLRLQVEPGPKNSSSWDYSFFGDAQIAVGGASAGPADLLKSLVSTRAYRVTENASRVALSNTPKPGLAPSNLIQGRNSLDLSNSTWRFVYQGEDCRVVYSYVPKTGTLDDFTAEVDDKPAFSPARGGGITVALPGVKEPVRPRPQEREVSLSGGRLLAARRDGGTLNVLWQYELEGNPLRVEWSFRGEGKALVVSVRCDETMMSRFSLGEVVAPLRRTINVPYLLGQAHYLPVQNVFVCRYLDWTVSQSSLCPQGNATYEPKTDGKRNPLAEAGYIAVSPDVGEVLPNLPHPPSPFLATLGPRVMLDIWGHARGGYAGDAASLRELKDNGVDHIVIIQHDWQRYGYDVKLPDHLPANPAYGGDEGMAGFGRAANECGYIWSLHENYIDLYPDAPSYDPAARVIQADGSPSKAWYNPGTKIQSFGLKCNRALGFARQNSPDAHRRYATTASYLDVHTCVPPWHQLDHEASQPMAAMQKAKVQCDAALFQYERETHHGPLFGEGANHFYWAGRCDGVEAQVEGGEDHTPFLDFDLLKIHPQMVNHGMGYYERWYRGGYNTQYGVDAGSVEQWDKYRAMELAYGHAGFLGHVLVRNVQAVAREHHLLHPVQRLYATARPVEIRYEVKGELVTASAALVAGDTRRQRIRYDNGLSLWINWRAEPWNVLTGGPARVSTTSVLRKSSPTGEHVLPQWGFLVLGPGVEVRTALQGGRVGDYAECPEYVFADARTWFDLPYIRGKKDVEPRLREFKHLGEGRAQVTYEWIANEQLDADYVCFVHGNNREALGPDHIVFQGDHGLPKPTSQWHKGEVIVDGPHELRISDKYDAYDLVIGLYKRERARLKGLDDGSGRICIAQLKLEKVAGRITAVSASKMSAETHPRRSPAEAEFAAHTNPVGTWIDFGKVATDGAVKVNVENDRLVIFPYPRNKEFRASLDLRELAPKANLARIRARSLAAGTQADLGPAEARVENGRLQMRLGITNAGRYVVTWD